MKMPEKEDQWTVLAEPIFVPAGEGESGGSRGVEEGRETFYSSGRGRQGGHTVGKQRTRRATAVRSANWSNSLSVAVTSGRPSRARPRRCSNGWGRGGGG